MNYATPEGQAWLRYWVGVFGPDSALARFLRDDIEPPAHVKPAIRSKSANGHKRPQAAKPHASVKSVKPEERAARRLERDVERVKRLPVSDWAKAIIGDARIQKITLQDILDSVEDYFSLFDQLRRVNREAYAYFSRVGAPIMPPHGYIWAGELTALTVATPELLPSYFGVFLARTKEQAHEDAFAKHSSLFDFHLFEKPKNHGTVAPLGSTIFTHNTFSLKRDIFTAEERHKFPHLRRNWGSWWYLGVLPDGSVRALPHRMQAHQRLPNGDYVHHSAFHIPPGLRDWAKTCSDDIKDAHDLVRLWFNIAVAATASATAGVTVTIRKGKRAARLGVPVSNLRAFFADRDPESEGARRKAIMHLRLGHDRHMADGRIIPVGEHLSGERFFTWRGYEVTVGVPGIHFPAPEAFRDQILIEGDPDAPLPAGADRGDLAPVQFVANMMDKLIRRPIRAPIRRGQPVYRYHEAHLPAAPRDKADG